jgi:hypothetical protein
MGDANLSLKRGDNHTLGLTVTAKSTGLVKDITGWTFYFTIKENITDRDVDALLQLIVTSHTNPTAGITAIPFVPEDTFNIEPGKYFFDIQVLTDDDEVYTIVQGRIEILRDITRTYGTAGTGA